MAKPKKKKAAPAAPGQNSAGHVEIDTDAPRQGPIGERKPLTEDEVIAASNAG